MGSVITRRQHSVGQGFFHSGHINTGDTQFRYVYDCGAMSPYTVARSREIKAYAEEVVGLVSTKACGSKKFGPFNVRWELGGDSAFLEAVAQLTFDGNRSCADVIQALHSIEQSPARDALEKWSIRQRDIAGRDSFSFPEILGQARKAAAITRARANRTDSGRRGLTVHQAKNREFDVVVVIWPYTVAQDDEGKRRLLYNAVTRAKRQCTIIVQGIGSAGRPPFR